MLTVVSGTAVLSADKKHRTKLTRTLVDREVELIARDYGHELMRGEAMHFCMLNPSKADATTDDHTIRKCMMFAATYGFARLIVTNAYSFRATDPKELKRLGYLGAGLANDVAIGHAINDAFYTVVAWGEHIQDSRHEEMKALLAQKHIPVYCLGINKSGKPKHPLMVSYETPLKRYNYV